MSGESPVDYIQEGSLIDRRLYRVQARNFNLAVYRISTNDFVGIRSKFGMTFLSSENHWDHKEFATVKPMLDLLEDLPSNINMLDFNSQELFDWLQAAKVRHGSSYLTR